MGIKETEYLKLPYNEAPDTGFREQYNASMEIIDNIFPNAQSIKYPAKPQSIFDDGIFSPTKEFEIRKGTSRYLVAGNKFFFEIGVLSKVAISVPTSGDIGNKKVGNINAAFPRKRGFYIVGMNGVAASYSYGGLSDVSVCAFGGMVCGTTVPKGTYFGFAGHYYLTD